MEISLQNNATAEIRGLLQRLEGRNTLAVIGRAGVRTTQDHLFRLDSERANGLGGRRTHFYSSAAKATTSEVGVDQVTVRISWLGISQRYHGGTIKPVNAAVLTIPACAEAYGRRAREFDHLHIVRLGSGPSGKAVAALVENDATKISRSKKGKVTNRGITGGRVMFWLVPSAYQRPDPTVLPTDQQYLDGALEGLRSLLPTTNT